MQRALAPILAMTILSLAGLPAARAEENPKKAAKVQFELGVKLFHEGKHEQASIAFDRAYELRPHFKLLWNIGQVENELGHYAAALVAYTRYLEEGGKKVPKKRGAKAREEIERLRNLVGTLVVSCPVEGAKVKVNNEARGVTPLEGPLYLDIGKHEVIVARGREELFREVVTVAGGKEVRVEVEDAPAPAAEEPAAEPAAEETTEEPADEEKPKRIWTWVAGGVGVAAGITGAILGGVALSKKNTLMDECGDGGCPESRKSDRDEVNSLALGADIMYAVAAVGVAAGVVLFFVEPKLGGEREEEVAVTPTAFEHGGGIAVSGRF
jgi:hypothetical protein